MDVKLIIMDVIILVNDDGNVLLIMSMDDESINVNDVDAINKLIINALELLNTFIVILKL